MNPTNFCWCGRPLSKGICPWHKDKIRKEPRDKIGRWSGKSRSVNKYNNYQ